MENAVIRFTVAQYNGADDETSIRAHTTLRKAKLDFTIVDFPIKMHPVKIEITVTPEVLNSFGMVWQRLRLRVGFFVFHVVYNGMNS